ncbi:MAG: phosphatidic acid phosphatase [Firmicutes bacterium]|nr:phosphatidic acid phosphatase [Bacillota bacterium]
MFRKIKDDKALWQVYIYMVLIIIFLVVDNINLAGDKIQSKIDDMIPFVPIFIIPYFAWFIFIVATGIILYKKSKLDLRKTYLSVNLCMLIGLVVFFLFPNYQTLRPEVYADDVFSQWVRLIQIGDSPSNVCPSLHVAISISLYTGLTHSACFEKRKDIHFFTLILTNLIILSTVFIKQHSVIDVAFGILLGVVVHIFVYKIYFNPAILPSRFADDNIGHEKLI